MCGLRGVCRRPGPTPTTHSKKLIQGLPLIPLSLSLRSDEGSNGVYPAAVTGIHRKARTMDRFDQFIERLLSHEGGYTNTPADPGGETQWGISKRSYPSLNIKKLTRTQAIEIYRRDFWEKSRADDLATAVGFQLLDAAVNSGIDQATRWLQQAVGVADDGVIGPVTLGALRIADQNDLVMRFNAARLDFMTRLATWPTFGKGWARRIAQNLRYAASDN